MPEDIKPVNLPFTPPDWVGQYKLPEGRDLGTTENRSDYMSIFNSLMNQGAPKTGQDFPAISTEGIDMSGRYPTFFPGRDNEELYAQRQTGLEKAYNGVAKMAGIASTTFVEGTAGLVYGVYKGFADGKVSSFYNNELTRELNDMNERWEDKYAHYKTQRERNGSWWEPSNLFTGNFLWDNIVKNLGFSLGAVGAGFAWGGALKAAGLTGRLAGAGAEMAAAADTAIAEASLLPQAQRLPTLVNRLETLWNSAKVGAGKGLMKADQGIVATFGTVGEAGLEALHNSQEFRQRMIEEFRNTRGYEPTLDDLKEIDDYAASVGNSSLFLNAALLTATNYIQLPKIYSSSFKAEKNILNKIKFEAGKYTEALPQEGFGKLLYKAKNVGSLFFNTAEAFEEGAQYAIQTGTQNYYGKRFRKQEASVLDDGILYGVEEALTSDEGLLNITTGGLSGALQSSGVFGIKKNDEGKYRPTLFGTGKIGQRGFTGYGGEEQKLRDDAMSALNSSLIKDKLRYSYSSLKAAEIIQKQREAAIRQGDVLESKDLEFDYAHTFIANRLKYNAKEAIDFEIESLRREASTEEGFRTLQQEGTAAETDTRPSFLARLDNLQSHANNAAKMYEAANIKYKGLVNKETGERVYSDTVIDKLVYAASKVKDYDNRIPQLSVSLFERGINVQNIIDDIISTGTPNKTATKEALDQINKTGGVDKDDLKTSLMDVIEMSLRRVQFLNEYDDIKANPAKYDGASDQFADAQEVDKVLVKQTIVPEEGGRKKTIEKELEVGKDYSLGQPLRREGGRLQYGPKMSVLSKTLGGEYEVLLPNGQRTFLKPGDFKAYDISDVDVTSPELADILNRSIDNVLSRKKYQDIVIRPGDKIEFVNSLNDPALAADIEKEFQKQSAEYMEQQKSDLAKKQRLLQYAEQLKRTQEEIEKSSGDFPTQSVDTDRKAKIKESRKKSKDRLYKSNISASLDNEDEDSLAPHIIRYNEFINNVKNLSNNDRKMMKAILITPKQEKFLKIEGLGEMSFKAGNLDVSKLNDKDFGFVGMIFIKDDEGEKSFVDKDGKVIGKLGDPIDINKIVFSTMPSASLFYNAKDKNGNPIPRYRDGEREAAIEELAGWTTYRQKLSEMAEDEYVMFDYGISKGIPVINKDNPEKNFAGGIIFPESKVAKEAVLEVVTKGSIAHEDGQNYKFPNGRPVAKYKDNLEFLNNTSFSKKKATAIYRVFKRMSDRMNQETLSQQDLSLEQRELTFIQNVLYWNSKPDAPASDNKVFIDTNSGDLVIGENRYDFANIGRYENQMVNALQDVFHNINNKTLGAGLSIPFYEFYINDNDELVDREWKNYQQYLLSSKYPNGGNRTIDDAPLITNISKPTPAVPFAFKQKYAYLKGLDFPVQVVKKEPKGGPKGKGITIDKYKLNDGTINDYEIAGKGVVKFVATQDPESGEIDVVTQDDDITAETLTKIVGVVDPESGDRVGADETLVTNINNNLKTLKKYDEKLNAYENAELGIPTLIKAKLIQLRGEFKTEEEAPVSDKKADIEKAGINNLLVSGLVTSPTTIEKGKQYLLATFTGYTGIASGFKIVTATGNKKEESQVSSGSGVSKNLLDTFINEKGQEVTTGGLNKKIVEFPTVNINDKKEVLTFLLNQAKSGKLLSASKGSALGLQDFNEDKTKNRLGFLNSDFTKGETWIDYDDSNRSQNTKLAKDFLIAKYAAELAALEGVPTAPAAPVSDTDLSNIESFETSKGSVYTVLPDGKVERFKTAANEKHEPAELLVFVKFDNSDQEEDFLSAQHRQGGMKLYVIDAEGNIYNKNSEVAGKNVKLAIIKDNKVLAAIDASTEPKIGYNTFDQRRFEKDGEKYRSTHLGNDVTKINYKSPTAPVSNVERNPVIGDTLTSDSNQNYKIRGITDKGGVQWENTKDGSKGVWSKEKFDEYIKNGRLKYDIAAPVVSDKKAEADKLTPIEQNFADGQGGRKMQSKFAGKSTMDLILSGDRTRTTRANTDIQRMLKDYGLSKIEDLVGKVIRMTDKQGRTAYTEITKVAPFTKEYQDATWQKEGWEKGVTDKLVGQYPYAIEFKLAALEGAKPAKGPKKTRGKTGDLGYRRVGVSKAYEPMSEAEIEYFKKFAAKYAPGIPYEFMENILLTHDNEEAFGVFENNVAKIFKRGMKGTAFHELMEGIWFGFLSPEKQAAIIANERTKKGTFVDRASGKTYDYNDPLVSDLIIKERIMDDFSDLMDGKISIKSLLDKVMEFFKAIIDFFKSFVQKPSLKEQLFKDVLAGKFKKSKLTGEIAIAPQYRRVPGLNQQQVEDYVQDIIARIFQFVFSENKSLFNFDSYTSEQLFGQVKEQFVEEGVFDPEVENSISEEAYDALVERTKDKLRQYRIEFDEDSRVSINDEGANKSDYAADAFTVDFKKSSPYAVKLLIATLLKTKNINQVNASKLDMPEAEESSTGGYVLLPFGQAWVTLTNRLSNTRDVPQFVKKLYNLAKENSDYIRLFKRLGGDIDSGKIAFNDYTINDWRLFIQFYQSFTKSKPNAVTQFIEGNQYYSGSSNQASAAKLLERNWMSQMRLLADHGDSIIRYDKVNKVYKVENVNFEIDTPAKMVAFLDKLGITFPLDTWKKLKDDQPEKFATAVSGIKLSLEQSPNLISLKNKTLGIGGSLSRLAELYISVESPSEDSTFFNEENKRQQAFTDSNAPSYFESVFNSVKTKTELLEKMPQLQDVFSTNSQVLSLGGLFFDEDGNRTKTQIKVGFVGGNKDKIKNAGKRTSDLSIGDRFSLEINQNLSGNYYVIVPADGSTEWMMNLGNSVPFSDFRAGKGMDKVFTIFQGYLKDEIALAKDAKNRSKLSLVGKKAKELRFFKDILSKDLLDGVSKIIANKKATSTDIETFINDNASAINADVEKFINDTVVETRQVLTNNKNIVANEGSGFNYKTLDNNFALDNSDRGYRLDKSNLTDRQVDDILTFANANYIINNIEYHKILFGDPYQFKITDKKGKVILDETKRIKSFLSPRRITFNSEELNDRLNDEYNKAVIKNKKGEVIGSIALTKDDYGYHEHKPYAKTFTARDVNVVSKLYPNVNESDASSLIMDVVYREVKTKNGQWPDEAEAFHQYQMAYTRKRLAEKGIYKGYANNPALQAQDNELLKRRTPEYKVEVLKPIVSGNKFNKNNIDLVLDKFSQLPLYYKAVEGTNLEKFYIKMFEEKYDYMVVESGRKVGAEGYYDLYKKNGKLNDEPFNNTINVPWDAYGIQVENSYEKDKLQTRGSQLTKLATVDLYSNGEPIGKTPEEKEYIKNQVEYNKDILEKMYDNGYKKLLKKLGIVDLVGNYIIEDKTIIANTLRREMLGRAMSENGIDSISINPETKDFDIAFEASTNYKEIKDILYSIVDKMIGHPKMNGFSGVQVASTMFESERQIAKKTEDGYVNITKEEFEELSDEEKEDVVLTSGALKFYEDEDGKRYCEVMLPNWMSNKFSKTKFPTEQSILKYLNSPEGREILTGVGFRIPTQALSSVEVFVVKGFLPEFMGRTVVVPSEITTKAGSDFDIDKLNMYLKNVYVDENGDVRLVRYKGSEEATKNFYADVFDNIAKKKLPVKKDLLEALQILENSEDDPKGLLDQYGDFIDMILEDEDIKVLSARLKKDIENMSDNSMRNMLKDEYMDKMYDKALENEYYKSLETLLQLPENFKRLTKPNESKSLEKIASTLDDLRGEDESVIKNRLLDRNYMTSLRHAFIIAKKWVGIGATSVTGNSLVQKGQIIVKSSDRTMVLPHNFITIDGRNYMTLSGMVDKAGQYISDKLSMYINAFVDVAKDPYILKIIYSDRIVGTVMMLERFGVPMETTALFMNQPIIREFVNMLDAENAGSSAIYNKKKLEIIRTKFPTTESLYKSAVINPSKKSFSDNISGYYKGGKLTDVQNAEQQRILDEFLDYSKLASANFVITQATNYDTNKFRSADDISIKRLKTELAESNNLISSPKKILNSSSLGKLSDILDRSSDALSAVLKFNLPEFREILEEAIRPYAVKDFISSDKRTRISEKLSASFLDYIIQIKSNTINVKNLVTGKESVADRIVQARIKYPDVKMLDELVADDSGVYDGTKTIRLKANIKDAYEENLMIGYMREMKAVPELRELYDDIVKVAIVQGNYQSAVSIKNIVPLEDYSRIVSPIINTLVVDDDVRSFSKLNWFQRNNWKDSDIVTRITPTFWNVNPGNAPFGVIGTTPLFRYYSPSFKGFEELGLKGSDRKIMTLPDYVRGSDMDVVIIPRIILKEDGEMIDFLSGETVTPNEFRMMKVEGSTVPDEVYGYQKVKYKSGFPVIDSDGNFVYKMINLHGDGQYASEYYKFPVKSVLNNNTAKIDTEIPDEDIIALFPESGMFSSAIDVVSSQPLVFDELTEFNLERKQEILANFAAKHKMTQEQAKDYISEALVKDRENTIAKLKECY